MSLNYKEIDLILSEIAIEGMKIERILQPSYDSLVLGLFGSGRSLDILISTAHGACRIHPSSLPIAKNERPLRFMECLRSRIRGGRIESCVQLGSDRIVKFTIRLPRWADDEGFDTDASGPAPEPERIDTYYLYVRLWSGAGNILLVDETGIIVDSLVRNPKKGEVSGAFCNIEADRLKNASSTLPVTTRTFEIRDLPGEGTFSQRVETHYRSAAGELSRDNLIAVARERYEKKARNYGIREAELSKRLEEFGNAERFREIGDILMAGYTNVPDDTRKPKIKSDPDYSGKIAFVNVFDFFRNEDLKVQIDPSLTHVENAQKYYEKYRKAVSGHTELAEELEKCRDTQKSLAEWLAAIESETDPFAMAKALEKAGTVREKAKRPFPCLYLEQAGWTFLVGRSAKENDDLLRTQIKGSDLWMHARDYSGSYVFVKAKKGKSYPLETLVEAANLAIYYSKARKNLEGDVYYTLAKYLRKVKGGPKGLVIASQEKNLHIKLDDGLVRNLLANAKGREDNA
jgi:predicted ribosome quality control (RQC) complex YloA/Tae2 family protein